MHVGVSWSAQSVTILVAIDILHVHIVSMKGKNIWILSLNNIPFLVQEKNVLQIGQKKVYGSKYADCRGKAWRIISLTTTFIQHLDGDVFAIVLSINNVIVECSDACRWLQYPMAKWTG